MDGKMDLEGGGVTEWEGRRPNWDGGRGAPVEGKVKYINIFLKKEFKVQNGKVKNKDGLERKEKKESSSAELTINRLK